jgi:thioesterase domain-containing protein
MKARPRLRWDDLNSSEPLGLWSLVARNSKPIVRLAGEGDGTPVYLVHAIGGDADYYTPLAEVIGVGRMVYGIQAPAQKISAEFAESIASMADYYADTLMRFQPEGPMILGGWSVGAVISLQIAQALKRLGREISLLISFDGILYNTGARLALWNPAYIFRLLRNMPRWIGDVQIARLDAKAIRERLRKEGVLARTCRAIEGNRPVDSQDLFLDMAQWPQSRVPFTRALYHALATYKPEPYEGRVLVYTARNQPLLHHWQVENCWAKIAPGAEFHSIWGRHQEMFDSDRARGMGSHLRDYLTAF